MPVRVLCWTLNAVFPEPGWNMDQQVVNQASYRRQHFPRLWLTKWRIFFAPNHSDKTQSWKGDRNQQKGDDSNRPGPQ
jgi:hypothetical protein